MHEALVRMAVPATGGAMDPGAALVFRHAVAERQLERRRAAPLQLTQPRLKLRANFLERGLADPAMLDTAPFAEDHQRAAGA